MVLDLRSLTPLDESSRFDVFRATTADDREVFVKACDSTMNDWNRANLIKEHAAYDAITLDSVNLPDPVAFEERKGLTLLAVEYVDVDRFDRSRLDDPMVQTRLLTSLTDFLRELRDHIVPGLGGRMWEPELYFKRMEKGVGFKDDYWDDYADAFSRVADAARDYAPPSTELGLVHADLFNPNLGFSLSGELEVVIDWEMAGRFDPMYDAAFIEAGTLDPLYAGGYAERTHHCMRREYRERLGITDEERTRLRLYKPWVYYVNLEAYSLRENSDELPEHLPPGMTVEAAVNQHRRLLDATLTGLEDEGAI